MEPEGFDRFRSVVPAASSSLTRLCKQEIIRAQLSRRDAQDVYRLGADVDLGLGLA
jgi:hypothetical protein